MMTMTTMMMMTTTTRIERGISLSDRAKRAAAALAEARNPVLAIVGGRAQHRFGDAGVAEALDLRPTPGAGAAFRIYYPDKIRLAARIPAAGLLSMAFATSRGVPILQAPEALLTLSFRLDLTIYRRYNPRT